ncbi:DUF481 domain-containing protein [Zunongwangia profunda]|uniref:DUF481 domain-containing protein n=1 Tax=Zunongwangia profunda (strain DSM 18752 / CCTCC AB 206139 / SM-A87) TaxID=655815 RepID=D5BH54_ZUNPS|nr:DUF481 domain-containing protein [Zunongwangia profunda]ADF51228.1 conserved hypothetical protein [Zunongwangia profunda SM-A87]MAG86331.1 DUF481 domain-containing protein [Flavobacteriaceae bacterium]MAS73020.1 DUF481 domain-containing protein [Zunongwangia sp.]|tara:strand:- start:3820 stop:4578 length:759 start_codon:yes stop_codon:yes gene_type:complete
MPKTLLLICLFLPWLLSAQLVNIETQRIQSDSTQFVLNADFGFDHSNNDGVTVNQIQATITTQIRSKDLKKTYLLLGNYNLVDADEGNLQNSWFLHGRFNYSIDKLIKLEAFLQGQYNQLLVVRQRNLIGAGVRFNWIDRKNFTGHLGNSYMYEVEYNDTLRSKSYNHRNSTYISFSYTSSSRNFMLTNTFYYQPLYRNLDDYRLLEQFRFDFPLNKWLKFFAVYDYYFDNETPLNTKEYTSKLQMGFGISI